MGDHYIPRLILRRFAARLTSNGRPLVFQYRKGHPPPSSPFAVDRIASEGGYYEHPAGIDIDQKGLHDHEERAGELLASIERGISPNQSREEAAMLVTMMMARTRALREQWADMVGAVLREGHRALASPLWGAVVRQYLRNNLREAVEQVLPDLLPEPRARAESLLKHPEGEQALAGLIQTIDFSSGADAFMTGLRSQFVPEAAAGKSQVEAMIRLMESRCVQWLDAVRFELLEFPQDGPRIILGDACVVGLGADGALQSPMALGPDCRARFLPVGPYRVLAAIADGMDTPSISPEELNRGSASLAREFFFSAGATESECALVPLIGSAPLPLPCDEIRDIAQNVIGSFPGWSDVGAHRPQ